MRRPLVACASATAAYAAWRVSTPTTSLSSDACTAPSSRFERARAFASGFAPRELILGAVAPLLLSPIVASAEGASASVILSGDVGGTNSRFQIWTVPPRPEGWSKDGHQTGVGLEVPGVLLYEKSYANENHPTFVGVLTQFISDATAAGVAVDVGGQISVACFAMAGPVNNAKNTVNFTNRSKWGIIDGHEIAAKIGARRVRLCNDFVTNGFGLLTLKEDELFTLQDADAEPCAPIACIGAGTGLGQTFLTWTGTRYEAFASEGGHADYAPKTELEIELLTHLKELYRKTWVVGTQEESTIRTSRVSVERVVSGKGIATSYDFLATRFPEDVDEELHAKINAAGDMKGQVIANNGTRGARNKNCRRAMDIFTSSYGSEAGDMALKFLPMGGLYIAGGIAPANLDYLAARRIRKHPNGDREMLGFMTAFLDKGRLTNILERIPVHVVLAKDLGQRGAHLLAYTLATEDDDAK